MAWSTGEELDGGSVYLDLASGLLSPAGWHRMVARLV